LAFYTVEAGTIKEQEQFSKLAGAIEQAGMAQLLQGGGPYTVFAPTDQAFEQLPEGALDELMKEENRDQLETLLQYHVVEGDELMAKDVVGKQTEVDTLAGDSLSVDGEGQMVLLVPTGLTVTRVGDQVMVERDVAAVTAPEVEVAPASPTASPSGQQTEITGQGDMPATEHQQQVLRERPATEHQQQVLREQPATERQQTAPQDTGMPPRLTRSRC
jgi:uncharacterized surface protein with fasciclin (FAS1) repeats